MNAIHVRNLRKKYGSFQLWGVTFTLPYGSIMGLIGENGAGKSTIMKCILNIVEKDAGEIEVLGEVLHDKNIALREDIGMVFDISEFYDDFTLKETQCILKGIYKHWDSKTFQLYVDRFHLSKDKKIKAFSRGMKMKTALAIALSHQPKLLILDEAMSSLDPIMRDEILDILLDFVQDEEHSVLISSHISSDLEKVADYITFIHEGKMILTKSKDTLLNEYGLVKCCDDMFDQIDPKDIIRYRKRPYDVEILVADRGDALRKYQKCIVDSVTLDDMMMLYVKGECI